MKTSSGNFGRDRVRRQLAAMVEPDGRPRVIWQSSRSIAAGPPTDLITQVAMRVTRLQARGWQLSAMVLVSNGRTDAPTSAARSVLARGLVAHLAASGGGSFALSVDGYLGRRAEHNLFRL